jgi:hypothetical protein
MRSPFFAFSRRSCHLFFSVFIRDDPSAEPAIHTPAIARCRPKFLVERSRVCYKFGLFSADFQPEFRLKGAPMAGLLSNTASLVRYAVEGELPANFWDFAADRIRQYSFRDIDDTFEERSIGWVSVMNMFDSQFAYASYAAGDYIMLSLRIDERKVPPALLKKFCLKEEERVKREKELPRLSKRHRLEIKENVHLMLLKKAMPGTAVYDLSWNLAEGTVLFFSTNKKAQETLEEFFKETFDLHLVLQIPYLTADHLLAPAEREALERLTPEIFI